MTQITTVIVKILLIGLFKDRVKSFKFLLYLKEKSCLVSMVYDFWNFIIIPIQCTEIPFSLGMLCKHVCLDRWMTDM